MEVSFAEEIKSLRLGEGDPFDGERILALKSLLIRSALVR
jgi:hypothetical protein